MSNVGTDEAVDTVKPVAVIAPDEIVPVTSKVPPISVLPPAATLKYCPKLFSALSANPLSFLISNEALAFVLPKQSDSALASQKKP